MKFSSTRGKSPSVDFLSAVLDGLAPDGGLYLPDHIPVVDPAWRGISSFQARSKAVMRSWLAPTLGEAAVDAIVEEALNFDIPFVDLSGGAWNDVTVVELFHGPTLSFKDFGARCMAGFMDRALKSEERRTILVATSGDTGSAVADGFAGHENIDVVLLYPRGQVSPTQERQLTVRRSGVTSYAVDGTFDDCQRIVKELFQKKGADIPRFSSANSINVGRLLPQMVYYFWAATRMTDRSFRCCVPSGNLGNLTAAVLAHLSGVHAAQFVAAHNANDFFPDFLRTGNRDYKPSVRTLSNAMDVGVPSNFERLAALLPTDQMQELIWSTSVDDDSTLRAMRAVYDATGYVSDPHTAVGLEAIRRYRDASGDVAPIAVMATAHPAKFPETVELALGRAPAVPERLGRYWKMETSYRIIAPDSAELLKQLTQRPL